MSTLRESAVIVALVPLSILFAVFVAVCAVLEALGLADFPEDDDDRGPYA